MRSEATTVEDYLAELPADRCEAISAVRAVIRDRLPAGIVERMSWGMISYEVPLETYPDTYNGQPLSFAALASQKQHMSVYLMGLYADDARRAAFEADYRATGKRLDAGKSCVRFRRLDDLPLDLIGDTVGAQTLEEFLAVHEASMSLRASKSARAKG